MYVYLRMFLIFVIMSIIYFVFLYIKKIEYIVFVRLMFCLKLVIVVNYIFYNFFESEILEVCIIVFVFIFYDIRKR